MGKKFEFSSASLDLSSEVEKSTGKKYGELTPSDFFEIVKGLKKDITDDVLIQQIENAEKKMKKFKITGQTEAAKTVAFYAETFVKERKLLSLGITKYILATDVNTYIAGMKNKRNVAFTYLERYERDIPDEIVDRIATCEGIFDKYAVLFTDYTAKVDKQAKASRSQVIKDRDPILFGMFGRWEESGECIQASPRMYVIGDWVDDQCDLTLSQMVLEFNSEEKGKELTHDVGKPSNDTDLLKDATEFVEGFGKIDET